MNLKKSTWLFLGLVLLIASCDDEDAKPDPPTLPTYDVQIKINHLFGADALELNQTKYITANKDTVGITRWMYHINKFVFFGDSGTVYRPDLYFLIDAENSESLTLTFDSLDHMAFDSIQFNVGVVDSADNYDGILNSMFTDPMYWGMINGYINMKLEGESNSVVADSVFLLHIGGYSGNYKLGHTVGMSLQGNKLQNKLGSNTLTIDVDLAEYFTNPNTIDLSTSNLIHQPNDQAKEISDNWPSMFSFGGIQ